VTTLLSRLLTEAEAARPSHPAVEDAQGSISYSDLARRAGQIAAELVDRGVRPGDRVGVLVPKTVDAVASLYGILYAGAAYVPLDVAAPPARLAYMIRNCSMTALLADAGQLARLMKHEPDLPLKAVLIATGENQLPESLSEALATDFIAPSDIASRDPLSSPVDVATQGLAYILYTSGSTGEPKGVMISHGNALAFVDWAHDAVGVNPDDRLSSHAPFHFDLSIFDLYVASQAAATVVLVPQMLSMFPVRLAEWIEQQAISVWYSVPSILVQLVERGRLDRFELQNLRRVLFAGEVFAPKYLRALMQAIPHARYFNLYGPTETNVCTAYEVTEPPDGNSPVPIGRPASGASISLRDDDGRVLSDVGAVGELWAAGPTVALGYWNDEAKTAQRFVIDSSGEDPAGPARCYRTGDLACRDESGELIFHGRRDHMIKSRGYRIELGEIESAMLSHPAVHEACALGIPDVEIGNRIRVCLALHEDAPLSQDELHRYLAERLPNYMLPQETFFFEHLPKTSTGKADRTALAGNIDQ